VLDFGIARVRDGMRSLHTRTGAALGTTPYMAPEQIKGVGVDGRVDLFAVGATMFRLVAKRRIHEAATESMLLVKMATQPAPPLASAAPGTPPGICLVVDRALQFERDQRYPDAATMQRDVQALRNGLAPPHASAIAGELGAPLREERTAAAAPLARSSQGDPGPAQAGPSPSALHASASWHGAMEATQLAPAPVSAVTSPTADPPSASAFVPPGYAGPSSFARPSAVPASLAVQRKAEDRTWVAIVLALVGASLVLLVVLAVIHWSGGETGARPSAAATSGAASGAASGPAAVDPDDPSWQPSSAKRPPAKPGATRPPRRKHGDD
jgi:eukaryotic-like serine/threonine-protein kinase